MQACAIFKCVIADLLQVVKQGHALRGAAAEGPGLHAAQGIREDDCFTGCIGKGPRRNFHDGCTAQRIGDDKHFSLALPARYSCGVVFNCVGELRGVVLSSPLRVKPRAGLGPTAQPNGLTTAVRGGVPPRQRVPGAGEQRIVDGGVQPQMARGDRHSDPAAAAVVIIIQHSIALFRGHCHGNGVADIGQRQDVRRAGAGKRRTGIVCARQRIAVGRGQGEGHTLPRGNGCGLGLRCKRRRGFQNDAALHRRGCRGGGTVCQQNQHGKDKHQAAQVEHILSEKICFLHHNTKYPGEKAPRGVDEEKAVTMK